MLVLGINTKEEIWLSNEVVLSFRRQTTGGGWKILIEAPKSIEIQRKPRDKETIETQDQESLDKD